MSRKRTAAEERRVRTASAFRFANMAVRVAETSVVRKDGDEYCVKSEKNPDWSGGCYDTKGEAEDRLAQVEAAKHAKGG